MAASQKPLLFFIYFFPFLIFPFTNNGEKKHFQRDKIKGVLDLPESKSLLHLQYSYFLRDKKKPGFLKLALTAQYSLEIKKNKLFPAITGIMHRTMPGNVEQIFYIRTKLVVIKVTLKS